MWTLCNSIIGKCIGEKSLATLYEEFYLHIVYLYYNVVFRLKFDYSTPHQKMVVDLNILFYACVHLYHMFVNRLTIGSILILHHQLKKKIQRKINHNFLPNFAASDTVGKVYSSLPWILLKGLVFGSAVPTMAESPWWT